MIKWEKLPPEMQNEKVKEYYDALGHRAFSLLLKRAFDIFASLVLIVLLSPVMLVLAIWIKCDSEGPVFYRSERVTRYNKTFRIFKFRTMVTTADKMGSLVTVAGDSRITRVGAKIRHARLDEFPQLFNVFLGQMSFVGTRPEVRKYVDAYSDEMMATLLLPAGVTSLASIYYKDEAELLDSAEDTDKVYVEKVLPAKMYYNLKAIKEFSFFGDIKVMFMTVLAVLGKKYKSDTEGE